MYRQSDRQKSIGGSKGGVREAPLLLGPVSFILMHFPAKIGFRPKLNGWHPLPVWEIITEYAPLTSGQYIINVNMS